MPTIASSIIPPPKSWEEFEEITLSATKLRWSSQAFFGNGRRGQRQDGVDIFGMIPDGRHVGVQCKNTISGLDELVIIKEIGNAESFEPILASLYIATTAPRDALLQKSIRKISADRIGDGKFSVDLLFWEDLAADLATDQQIFFKHYPQFSQVKNSPKYHDERLYAELMELLPSGGVIEFLDENNMAGFLFLNSKLDPLRKFYKEWHRPERTFINAKLESIRLELWQRVGSYLNEVTIRTFSSITHPELYSIPQDLEIQNPKLFWEIVNRLHSLAEEIVQLHRVLVLTAREYFFESS